MFTPSRKAAGAFSFFCAFACVSPSLATDGAGNRNSTEAVEPSIKLEGSWTQYAGASVNGPVDDGIKYGGRLDLTVSIPGQSFGLSEASGFTLVPECVYGKSVNGSPGAGLILPTNSGLNFPSANAEDCDIAAYFNHKTGSGISVSVGKINTQANSRATPLVGGGALDGFQHGFLPTPPTFISQRTILGALITIPTKGPTVTLGLWDPVSAVNRSSLNGAFSQGIAGQIALNFAVKPRGLDGSQKLTLMLSSQDGLDFDSIPEVGLPPESQQYMQKSGRWHLQYSFHQYVSQDAETPNRGWGVFGRFGVWDGNPTPFERLVVLGVIGNVPNSAREKDKFGLAWFNFTMSDDLVKGLQTTNPIASESGIEMFYTFDLHKHFRLTFSGLYLDPAFEGVDRSTFLGMRAHVPF